MSITDLPGSADQTTGTLRDRLRKPQPQGAIRRYLARFDDGEVLRWAFRGLLIGAIGVLAIDLRDLIDRNGWTMAVSAPTEMAEPMLPPAVELDGPAARGIDPRPFLTTDAEALRHPILFELKPGGVLEGTGTIDPGAATRFAAELEARGEYVKTVAFNSPGGSLDDAMEMARLIRERGLSTSVDDGALCASSCPLAFAGGVTRKAGEKAAIGVHQFYALPRGERPGPDQAMADAQATTARISRHLTAMGVDAALWLHALDTPPRELSYLSADELAEYRLVGAEKKTAKAG